MCSRSLPATIPCRALPGSKDPLEWRADRGRKESVGLQGHLDPKVHRDPKETTAGRETRASPALQDSQVLRETQGHLVLLEKSAYQ